jgi:hypothetical protein
MVAKFRFLLIGLVERLGQEVKCFVYKGMDSAPRLRLFLSEDPRQDFRGVRAHVPGKSYQPSVAFAQSVIVQKRLREILRQLILRELSRCPHLYCPMPGTQPLFRMHGKRDGKTPRVRESARSFGFQATAWDRWYVVRDFWRPAAADSLGLSKSFYVF